MTALSLLIGALTFGAAVDSSAGTPTPRMAAASLRSGTSFAGFAAALLTRPAPVTGSDGFVHLAYELVLTNVTPRPLRIDLLQVLDARTHRALLSLRGGRLSADVNPLGDQNAAPSKRTTVPSSAAVIVWLDVRLRPDAKLPAALDHRVVASLVSPPPGAPRSIVSVLVPVPTVRHGAIVLGPPVEPGLWYASEGCCSDDTHHRRGVISINGQLQVPQRFAIDWYRLDSRRRVWVGDRRRLSSYVGYRQPVIAAANGTVVDTQDGVPNNPDLPKNPPVPPIQNTVGNHVVIRLARDVYLLYGHLTPGSLRVHRGQRVGRGQILGLIGTSGNSTIPHLHFQVMTTPTFFPTDSPPYVFDRFALLGRVPTRIWDENMYQQPSGTLPFAPAPQQGMRTRQLPLDRSVVRFFASR